MHDHRYRKTGVLILAIVLLVNAPSLYAAISVEGGLTHERTARPGETYRETITLRNQSQEPSEVKVYQTDYWFNHEGKMRYDDPGTLDRSNARWINVNPVRVTVPPMDRAVVSYTVNVPKDDDRIGTYWSILMVEEIPPSSPEASGRERTKQPAVGIVQVMRYAVQVITHIGEGGLREVSFLKTSIVKEGEQRLLKVDVENTGQVLVRPQVYTELFKDDGTSMGRFPGERYRLYPKTSRRFTVDVSTVPPGTYRAVVIADCGEDAVFGITYTFVFER
ncbi:MAG TPA: hypothetical protein PLS81_01105 [Deltaproteobacteria bacterium]|nr:hypothetical protein [Deltaproteobacteria bacterium]HOM28040.1 hypothetical protein [Deltaproteobacteria bacterium]HPP80389.1 hypothetical protein [Deltaproteobacteria bacterium]